MPKPPPTRRPGHQVLVRPMQPGDIPAVQELQRRCFPGIAPWSDGHFRNQLTRFAEGQIVVEFDGRIVATSSSLIVQTADFVQSQNSDRFQSQNSGRVQSDRS